MTGPKPRPLPADMLLLAERRKRMSGQQLEAGVSARPSEEAQEILATDEDQLLEAPGAEKRPHAQGSGDKVMLRRPIEFVSLSLVGWSSRIDHDSLQSALLCFPIGSSDLRSLGQLWSQPPFPLDSQIGAAALEVALSPGDLELLHLVRERGAASPAQRLFSAISLPDRIAGAEPTTALAANPVLSEYRHSSLSWAWHMLLTGSESETLHRERDEAAVSLLSTLRALLGER